LDKKVVIINKPYKILLTPYLVSWVEAAGASTYTQAELTAGLGTVGADWQGILTCNPATSSSCDIEFDAANADAVAEWKTFVSGADVIIDQNSPWGLTTVYGKDDFVAQYGEDYSAKVYKTDGILKALGGGSDWFEGRYSNPDWLLDDLRAVCKGDATRDLKHMRKLVGDEPFIQKPEHCEKTMPACDSTAAIAVIHAPCETYKTCVTVEDVKASAPVTAAAALLLLAQL
jgi:hypothetical protein